MTRSVIIYLIGVLFLTINFSCKTEKNPVSSNDSPLEISPLKLNNQWYLKFTSFDSLGNPSYSRYDTITVCCDTIYSGHTFFRYSGLTKTWYYNDARGLWRVTCNPGSGFDQPVLNRKYPCSQGDQFDDGMVVSVDTVVNVEYGEVRCILYRTGYQSGITYIDDYMKPGIGSIKSTIYLSNSNQEFVKFSEYELVDYKLE